MVVKTDFYFPSSDGVTNVHAVKWMPENGEYKAIFQITHGMVEYIDRYDAFAGFMAEHGFLVVGHDHIGHGDSIIDKNKWGFFGKNPSDLLVSDMHKLRILTQEENKDVPYIMMGHSMGSYMLRKYLSIHGEGVHAAIIMGTGQVPDGTVKMAMTICKCMAAFKGWDYRSTFIRDLSYGKPYKKFDCYGKDTKNSWLNKDEECVKAYYADPRCTFVFTLNAYLGLFEAVLHDNQPENINRIPKNLPIFMVSGADDPVGDLGEGVKLVFNNFKKAGISDVSMKLYEGDRHEILNEPDKETVYNDILNWVEEKL